MFERLPKCSALVQYQVATLPRIQTVKLCTLTELSFFLCWENISKTVIIRMKEKNPR